MKKIFCILTFVVFCFCGIAMAGVIPGINKTTLIVSKTAAETSSAFYVRHGDVVSVLVSGLSGSEEVEIEMETSVDGTFVDIYWLDDTQITLTATRNIVAVNIPGTYRVVKPVTSVTTEVIAYSEKGVK